jgi:hypothetical protein
LDKVVQQNQHSDGTTEESGKMDDREQDGTVEVGKVG